MASKELIEKVAKAISNSELGSCDHWDAYVPSAQAAISTILAALQEPTEGFNPEKVSYHKGMTRLDWWRAMLAASTLGDQSE